MHHLQNFETEVAASSLPTSMLAMQTINKQHSGVNPPVFCLAPAELADRIKGGFYMPHSCLLLKSPKTELKCPHLEFFKIYCT